MKKFKSLCFAMVFFMALAMLLPTSAYAAKSAGTIRNNVKVVMEYSDKTTVPIHNAKVGIKGGLLGTKFLLGSDYHECNNEGKVTFKQTSRITDMYFELPDAWKDKVETEGARAEYRAKLIGNFRYRNYNANIINNKFKVGMPLAWTTVDTKIYLKAKSFDVAFETDNGSDEIVRKVEYLKPVEEPTAPSREGYTFKGWYKGDKEFDFSTPITDNITLTAKWEINEYTVKFDSNGGTAVPELIVNHGEKVIEPEKPTKEGHNFLGWYKDGAEFNFETPITEDITLTAKWEINKYTLTFKNIDGTYNIVNGFEHGKKFKENPNFLSAFKPQLKEGFIFKGWADEYDVQFTGDTVITRDMILHPTWKLDTKIDSSSVKFYIYNADWKGRMSWEDKYFAAVDEKWGYVSNVSKLVWQKSGALLWKRSYVEAKDMKDSKLYDPEGEELDVKKLVDETWINAKMKDKYKNSNYELRLYRLTKVRDGSIHVDLAFYDAKKGNWVHELY